MQQPHRSSILKTIKPCQGKSGITAPFIISTKFALEGMWCLRKRQHVDVNAFDSIWEVKRRIQDREGYSPEQLRRVYHRKELADEKLLSEYEARERSMKASLNFRNETMPVF